MPYEGLNSHRNNDEIAASNNIDIDVAMIIFSHFFNTLGTRANVLSDAASGRTYTTGT